MHFCNYFSISFSFSFFTEERYSFMKLFNNCMINLFCLLSHFMLVFTSHLFIVRPSEADIKFIAPVPWRYIFIADQRFFFLPYEFINLLSDVSASKFPFHCASVIIVINMCIFQWVICNFKRIGIPVYSKLLFTLKTSSWQQLPKRNRRSRGRKFSGII